MRKRTEEICPSMFEILNLFPQYCYNWCVGSREFSEFKEIWMVVRSEDLFLFLVFFRDQS